MSCIALYWLNSLLSIGQPIVVGYDGAIVAAPKDDFRCSSPLRPQPRHPCWLGDPNTTVRDSDGAVVYAVQAGNSLLEIALIYNLSLEELYALNGLNGASLLSVGQEIVVGYLPQPDEQGGSADLPVPLPTSTPRALPPRQLPGLPRRPRLHPSPRPFPLSPWLAPPTPTPIPTAVVTGGDVSNNLFLMLLGAAVSGIRFTGRLVPRFWEQVRVKSEK